VASKANRVPNTLKRSAAGVTTLGDGPALSMVGTLVRMEVQTAITTRAGREALDYVAEVAGPGWRVEMEHLPAACAEDVTVGADVRVVFTSDKRVASIGAL
jgi:hypothetical protein